MQIPYIRVLKRWGRSRSRILSHCLCSPLIYYRNGMICTHCTAPLALCQYSIVYNCRARQCLLAIIAGLLSIIYQTLTRLFAVNASTVELLVTSCGSDDDYQAEEEDR